MEGGLGIVQWWLVSKDEEEEIWATKVKHGYFGYFPHPTVLKIQDKSNLAIV